MCPTWALYYKSRRQSGGRCGTRRGNKQQKKAKKTEQQRLESRWLHCRATSLARHTEPLTSRLAAGNQHVRSVPAGRLTRCCWPTVAREALGGPHGLCLLLEVALAERLDQRREGGVHRLQQTCTRREPCLLLRTPSSCGSTPTQQAVGRTGQPGLASAHPLTAARM